MSRDISIVIPTYNRPKILDMVLDSYCVQEDLKEIVIVNDCSMNEYSFITKYKNKYKDIDFITIDRDKHYGQAAARNTGIKKCTGKYILMGEDDAFLRSDYTKVLKKKIRESKKDGNKIFCCGSIFYDYNPNATKEEQKNTIEVEKNRSDPLFDYKLFLGYYRKGLNEDSQIPFGHALIMVESVAYNGIEYCEEFGGNESREEQDGQLQIAKKGYKCIITPDTECYHLATNLTRKPQSLKQWLNKHYYNIVNNKIFLDRNYDFIKNEYGYTHSKTYFQVVYSLNIIKSAFLGICDRAKRTLFRK